MNQQGPFGAGSMNRLSEIEHGLMQYKAQMGMSQYGGPSASAFGMTYTQQQQGPSPEHQELLAFNHKLMGMYNDLMKQHGDLQMKHTDAMMKNAAIALPKPGAQSAGKAKAACLGVIRLDYDYPPAPGDIDHPGSFGYDVYYRVVPGFTFDVCQHPKKMTSAIEQEFVEAVGWLVGQGVSGITGDCGFMMYMQQLARRHTTVPVFMSSLAQLPAVTCGFSRYEQLAIMTANSASLEPMRELIRDECGVDTDDKRYIMVGAQNVPGFEAVAAGGKVNVAMVTPGMVQLAKETLKNNPKIRGFLLECTELPPYSDAIRSATGLPVWDSITCCDFFIAGRQDNVRFGINNWQNSWDGKQEDYQYGQNLGAADRAKLTNKCQDMPLRAAACPT